MGLFGGASDRGEMLALENRVARLEEQVARLSAALAAKPAPPEVTPAVSMAEVAAPPADDGYAKVVREQSGVSLKAAKDLVESW